jgi:hypothetical protein
MTLGKPLMISRADALLVPFPSNTEDGCLLSGSLSDSFGHPQKPSGMEFYVQSLQLFTITEETLRTMYSAEATYQDATTRFLSPKEKLERFDFTTLVKIDHSLQRWKKALPQMLQVRGTQAEELMEPTLSRLANILHLR